jgi:hypothetical protein
MKYREWIDRQLANAQKFGMKYTVVLFLLASFAATAIVYYDVVFQAKTLLSPGMTAGVMGDAGPYGYKADPKSTFSSFGVYLKDMGSNAWAGEPQVAKVSQVLRQVAFPLWNDNVQFGKPLAANFLSSAFYPLKLVVYAMPGARGWDAYLLMRFVVGVFFTYLFLRQIGVRNFPSFVGGIVFAFSGFFILFQNIQNIDSDILAPMVFWAVAYIVGLAKRAVIRPYQYFIAIAGVVTSYFNLFCWAFLLDLSARVALLGRESNWRFRFIPSHVTRFCSCGCSSIVDFAAALSCERGVCTECVYAAYIRHLPRNAGVAADELHDWKYIAIFQERYFPFTKFTGIA